MTLCPSHFGGNGTMRHHQDSNNRKAVQRREVFTAWFLLSAPLIGFVAYLLAYLGLHFGGSIAPIIAAVILAVSSLFLVSWLFISQTDADWRKTTRFIAIGLIFEGFVLFATKASGGEASVYFGVGLAIIGLTLLLAAKKH